MEHQLKKKNKNPTKHIKSKRKQYISFCTELGAAYQFIYPKEVKSTITDRKTASWMQKLILNNFI